MPTAPPVSRDAALETQVFWLKYKTEIVAVIIIALLAGLGFGGYRLYASQQASAAASRLGDAKTSQEYQAVIESYPNTPAAASASLLLAELQRNEKKFAEANTTLRSFIDKHPDHEFVPTAKMAIAANLETMGKMDEALAEYQQIAASYSKNFNAPLALISEVGLLKAKDRTDEARQICERIMTEFRESLLASEAARQLRLLKPKAQTQTPPTSAPPGMNRSVPPALIAHPGAPIAIPPSNPAPSAPPRPVPSANKPR
jgi:predicted negative regulator of RcsB-dependent stress response